MASKKTIISEWMREALLKLRSVAIENPRMEARLLLCHHLRLDAAYITAFPEQEIIDEDGLNKMLDRRLLREPLSHIVGFREFWSMEFKVSADVLDPRADSEALVEALLGRIDDKFAPLKLIDFGTGSGCLLLALLSELPNATGLGVDLSKAALTIAQRNSKKHALDNRCAFIQSNWGEKVSQNADIILSNPPYIPSKDIDALQLEVKNYEPHLALDGGKDGLTSYPVICEISRKLLKKNGLIGFEFGINQEKYVQKFLNETGFSQILTHKDLGGINRIATARL